MNRLDILETYEVNKYGIIVSPGKFQGEALYAPEFYSGFLDGCGEDLSDPEDNIAVLLAIEETDRCEYPELGSNKYVLLTEHYQGFVILELIADENEADKVRTRYNDS